MFTIDDLLSTTPFYIAHRGSGDNWVEHSLDAYSHSVRAGAKALELSVSATSDGVLVCHHDTTIARLTGNDVTIGDVTYATLMGFRNNAKDWLGPAAAEQPIPRLKDVLDAWARTHVIFIEDKQGTNTAALLKMMQSYPDSHSHFVWKQWAAAQQVTTAHAAGFKTWGYFTSEIMNRVDELAPKFDFLGVHHDFSDSDVNRIVSVGKPVIVWEVHYRSVRDRMSSLGVAGMMVSNLPYVTSTKATSKQDAFSSGLRAVGDLPWSIDFGTRLQPTIDSSAGSISIAQTGMQSYLMGSLSPVSGSAETIDFALRWPKSLPQAVQHAGLAFGLAADSPYRVGIPSQLSGYHVVIRANGSMELFSRQAGTAGGTQIAQVQTPAPAVGEWVHLRIEFASQAISVSRLDGATRTAMATGLSVQPGYLWLCKNYPDPVAVEFKDIVVR